MLPREIIKKIRRIEIQTSRIVNEQHPGSSTPRSKAGASRYEEVQPYEFGDDVPPIDWNVTAHTGRPFMKLFSEEREMAVHPGGGPEPIAESRDPLADQNASWSPSSAPRSPYPRSRATTRRADTFHRPDGEFVPAAQRDRHVLRMIRELVYCDPIGGSGPVCRKYCSI